MCVCVWVCVCVCVCVRRGVDGERDDDDDDDDEAIENKLKVLWEILRCELLDPVKRWLQWHSCTKKPTPPEQVYSPSKTDCMGGDLNNQLIGGISVSSPLTAELSRNAELA